MDAEESTNTDKSRSGRRPGGTSTSRREGMGSANTDPVSQKARLTHTENTASCAQYQLASKCNDGADSQLGSTSTVIEIHSTCSLPCKELVWPTLHCDGLCTFFETGELGLNSHFALKLDTNNGYNGLHGDHSAGADLSLTNTKALDANRSLGCQHLVLPGPVSHDASCGTIQRLDGTPLPV